MELIDYWYEWLPPSISLQKLLSSFTNWRPEKPRIRQQSATEFNQAEHRFFSALPSRSVDTLPIDIQAMIQSMKEESKPN